MINELGIVAFVIITNLTGAADEQRWPDQMPWDSIPNLGYAVKEIQPARIELTSPRQASNNIRPGEVRVTLRNPSGYIVESLDRNSFRVFRFTQSEAIVGFTQSNDGEITVSLPDNVRIIDEATRAIAIRIPRSMLNYSKNDRIGLLALAHKRNSSERVWIACARSFNSVPDLKTSFEKPSISFGGSCNQTLVDGKSRPVARTSANLVVSNILPINNGIWTDLAIDAAVSSERLDPHAVSELKINFGRRFGASSFGSANLQVGLRGSQSGRTFGSFATIDISEQLSAKSVYRPSSFILVGSGPVLRFGLHAENRWNRDNDFAPYHVSPQVAYMSAAASVGPVWIFPRDSRQGSSKTDCSLWMDFCGYYLPNDLPDSGYAKRSLEGCANIRLELPLKFLIWVPSVFCRTGAIESLGFDRKTQWGIELTARF